MNSVDFVYSIEEQVENFVQELKTATAEQLGLDRRAGSSFYIDDSAIIVPKYRDNSLQYYGGFEYVEKDYRKEIGEYVFYFAEDDRVNRHLSRLTD